MAALIRHTKFKIERVQTSKVKASGSDLQQNDKTISREKFEKDFKNAEKKIRTQIHQETSQMPSWAKNRTCKAVDETANLRT